MDLSWCLNCDRHCVEDNLYCSDKCQLMDKKNQSFSSSLLSTSSTSSTSSLSPHSISSSSFSPNPSPSLDSFFSSLSHPQEHRNSIVIPGRSPSLSSYPLFAPISDT
ncbi:hypothetical protein BJ944DRAFT_266062 [Cunninghamella echinulata]|nr:hypothetical protein BJ944DRAFT_266062 [Cunninghamella echinulata]